MTGPVHPSVHMHMLQTRDDAAAWPDKSPIHCSSGAFARSRAFWSSDEVGLPVPYFQPPWPGPAVSRLIKPAAYEKQRSTGP